MKFTVHLVIDAERDLFEIYRYDLQNDSAEKADRLLADLEKTIINLESMPFRGHYPPELERIGVYDFREIISKPYRIIYQVIKRRIYVHSVLDGRRNLQDLLYERFFR